MIEWAWNHSCESLYAKSIRSSMAYTDGHDGMAAVVKIAHDDIAKSEKSTAVEWDNYFGTAIDGMENLRCLTESLAVAESAVLDSLKPSFRRWKSAKERLMFESVEHLDIKHESFILSKLRNSSKCDAEEISYLMLGLRARGEKRLIISLVKKLLGDTSAASQSHASETANKVLESIAEKIALKPAKLAGGYSLSGSQVEDFCSLLKKLLAHGLETGVSQLLDLSWENINACDRDGTLISPKGDTRAILEFIDRLCCLLRDYKVLHLDSMRRLFTLMISRYKHSTAPPYPQKLPGLSYCDRASGLATPVSHEVADETYKTASLQRFSRPRFFTFSTFSLPTIQLAVSNLQDRAFGPIYLFFKLRMRCIAWDLLYWCPR
ncbi:hypothetical protein F4777DRAFT_445755 [Nemania sp. FL0916]|nr:hypothetical protein F4777DRAFT_445755 [Nemania sp. FL0916]